MRRERFNGERGTTLYRSRTGSVCGVCKGIAQYFGFSVGWTRVGALAFASFTGIWPAVFLYIVAAMVMKPEPVVAGVRSVRTQEPADPGRLILMCPRGRKFDQETARKLTQETRLIFVAGHYEGYDERIVEILKPDLLSIGDYVLTGGELPALVVIDAVVRLLPGVLGDAESTVSESFAPENEGMLEYPQYTRPAVFEGLPVPDILVSGDHAKVAEWRRQQALERTKRERPDLLT